MKKLLTSLISTLFLVTLIGCGGGDSSTSTPTDPDQEFSLVGYKDLTAGKEIYNSAIFGSDSEGNSITGGITIVNYAQKTLGDIFDGSFDGILVTPRWTSLHLEINDLPVLQSYQIDYYDESAYLILVETMVNIVAAESTNIVFCVPAFPYTLPDSVKIGDTGVIPTFTCDDGTTQEQTWRIDDAKDGNIFFITNAETNDSSGSAVSTTEIKMTINSESEVLRFETTTQDVASGYTVTVSSDAPQ